MPEPNSKLGRGWSVCLSGQTACHNMMRLSLFRGDFYNKRQAKSHLMLCLKSKSTPTCKYMHQVYVCGMCPGQKLQSGACCMACAAVAQSIFDQNKLLPVHLCLRLCMFWVFPNLVSYLQCAGHTTWIPNQRSKWQIRSLLMHGSSNESVRGNAFII